MNILDETVGAMDWKREHTRNNANCIVSIWDKEKQQWISKEDTGTESNTEAEKGLASDSFKRACVNWGIGRELYTAPFIWIPNEKCNIETKIKNIELDEVDFSRGEFIKTILKDVDFSNCQISNLTIDTTSLQGLVIDQFQAIDLVGILGVKFK